MEHWTNLGRFWAFLGCTSEPIKDMTDGLSSAEVEAEEERLERAAAAIREAYAETDADLADALRRGENPTVDICVL